MKLTYIPDVIDEWHEFLVSCSVTGCDRCQAMVRGVTGRKRLDEKTRREVLRYRYRERLAGWWWWNGRTKRALCPKHARGRRRDD